MVSKPLSLNPYVYFSFLAVECIVVLILIISCNKCLRNIAYKFWRTLRNPTTGHRTEPSNAIDYEPPNNLITHSILIPTATDFVGVGIVPSPPLPSYMWFPNQEQELEHQQQRPHVKYETPLQTINECEEENEYSAATNEEI